MTDYTVPDDRALVVAGSHRSRDYLHRLVGEGNHRELFSFRVATHPTEIPADRLDEALTIRGVREVKRPRSDYHYCWEST